MGCQSRRLYYRRDFFKWRGQVPPSIYILRSPKGTLQHQRRPSFRLLGSTITLFFPSQMAQLTDQRKPSLPKAHLPQLTPLQSAPREGSSACSVTVNESGPERWCLTRCHEWLFGSVTEKPAICILPERGDPAGIPLANRMVKDSKPQTSHAQPKLKSLAKQLLNRPWGHGPKFL